MWNIKRLAAFWGSFLLSQSDLILHHKLLKGQFGLHAIVIHILLTFCFGTLYGLDFWITFKSWHVSSYTVFSRMIRFHIYGTKGSLFATCSSKHSWNKKRLWNGIFKNCFIFVLHSYYSYANEQWVYNLGWWHLWQMKFNRFLHSNEHSQRILWYLTRQLTVPLSCGWLEKKFVDHVHYRPKFLHCPTVQRLKWA